jgi:transcriptional regulator with XRE-family HTH domain
MSNSKDKAAVEEFQRFAASVDRALLQGKIPLSRDLPSLGEALCNRRQELGLSQAEAALRSGVPLRTWRSWEADSRRPSEEELLRAVVALEEPSHFRLGRLWRGAPRRMLGLELEEEKGLLAARSVARLPESPEQARLRRLHNLDPLLQQALRSWCAREGRGRDDEAAALALEEARQLPQPEQEYWVLDVSDMIAGEAEDEEDDEHEA